MVELEIWVYRHWNIFAAIILLVFSYGLISLLLSKLYLIKRDVSYDLGISVVTGLVLIMFFVLFFLHGNEQVKKNDLTKRLNDPSYTIYMNGQVVESEGLDIEKIIEKYFDDISYDDTEKKIFITK